MFSCFIKGPGQFNGKQGRALQPEESPTFVETWKDMEKLLATGKNAIPYHNPGRLTTRTGKTRTIGVSNFSIKTLNVLLRHASVVPAVNQVEAHPCLPQHALLSFCTERRIVLTAYAPVGKHKYAEEDEDIAAIAQKKNITTAQVLLSWGVQRGTVVVPKSERQERIRQNISVSATSILFEILNENRHSLYGLIQTRCRF